MEGQINALKAELASKQSTGLQSKAGRDTPLHEVTDLNPKDEARQKNAGDTQATGQEELLVGKESEMAQQTDQVQKSRDSHVKLVDELENSRESL